MITVLVADDHPVVRAGLVGMLAAEPDIQVVAEAGHGSEALARTLELAPDVVLMDLRMPVMDGADATAAINAVAPQIRVIILTTYDTDADVLRAIEAGAVGFLLKDIARGDLADAVRAAAQGRTVLDPRAAGTLRERSRQGGRRALAPREREVLEYVANGLTNADIARRLFISEATVKTYLVRIFEKLDVGDRTAAVTTAIRLGEIPP